MALQNMRILIEFTATNQFIEEQSKQQKIFNN